MNDLITAVACPQGYVLGALRVNVKTPNSIRPGRIFRWVPEHTPIGAKMHAVHVSEHYKILEAELESKKLAPRSMRLERCTYPISNMGSCSGEPLQDPPPNTPENTMIDIQHKTFVNGGDIDHMSDAQLFEIIRMTEMEIAQLEAIKNKPKRLQAKIKQLQDGINAIVVLLDGRDGAPTVGDIID